ncbi:uncharacterized protein FSUBG_6679 [Fusarium subglutinans]|uniref:Uncharacterized protein n=1 Tax=Gibberella subglutinans TaxID=42677 RepID=A0A8H5PXG7_GIBSU|nr:uncharacterized protein FSUBG_6679 [Fusarium subglutinans]KAF5604950.1 hypothetical protein FSUBG_6679 [Fusarium subglutinans]
MAFLFQLRIFGNYILPTVYMNVPTTPIVLPQFTITPVQLLPLYRPVFSPPIRIKVIYHRAGTVLASNDACYNHPPARATVLGNLTWWSEQHGLGNAYTRRCTLYLTRSYRSILTINPIDGPVSPSDLVKKVSFGDMTTPEFHTLMVDTVANNYGAFILVDHGYVPIKIMAQQTDNDQSTPPSGNSNDTADSNQNNSTDNTPPAPPVARQPSPSSTSLTDVINTDAPEPSNTGDNTAVPESAKPETDTTPAATDPEPAPKMPKVASVEPDDTEE